MKLFDVNVLLYAHFQSSPEHAAYAELVRSVAEGPEPFGVSELVLSGFLRVATHRPALDHPSSVEEALAVNSAGSLTVALAVAVQPLASVTVNV